MNISDRKIPDQTPYTVFGEPVLGQPGIEALSPLIASVIARWSVLEKQLDLIHTLATDDDDEARIGFEALKGWDRRFQAVANAATQNLPEAKADLVRAVLSLSELPAKKRHEIAHGEWAIAKGHEGYLALLPLDFQRSFGRLLVAAKKAGTSKIPADVPSVFEHGRLVSADDLALLVGELELSKTRMEALIFGHLVSDVVAAHEGSLDAYRHSLSNDAEVKSRIRSMEQSRRQQQRKARRQPGPACSNSD